MPVLIDRMSRKVRTIDTLDSPVQSAAIPDPASEGRHAPRSNMFIAAVLRSAASTLPVKIRNMSNVGALVEGATVPETGSAVFLIRGSLSVPAQVVWSAQSRCGLRFSSLVSIKEWLAPPKNREQNRVDDTVRLVKAGAIPLLIGSEDRGPAAPSELGLDLRTASQLLEAHCDALFGDPEAVARHGEQLQDLDIALQMIRAVSDMLIGDAPDYSTASRLQNLRTSSRQALSRNRKSLGSHQAPYVSRNS